MTPTAAIHLLLIPFIPSVPQVATPQTPGLGGTSWQLVRFQGSDDTALTPDVGTKYTIAFGNDGRVNVRLDCNRGSGAWHSAGPNQLQLGPLAITRIMCLPGSLHDRIARHWTYVRSYLLKDGRLFLSLMADGGTYEFEPLRGPGGGTGPGTGPVQGTATYRERIRMPPDAVFEVTLEDVSRTGGRAEVIARLRNEQPGNPPIPFLIAYDPARISPNRRYAVRARILVNERLWFTSDQNYPVLTGGHGSEVQILLRRSVSGRPVTPGPGGASAAPLENTYWKLISLDDTPVTVGARQQEPHFLLHPATGRVTGSGGCNRLSGSYEAQGDRVRFSQMIRTMMACVEGMETEAAFVEALDTVSRWKVTGQQLELFDAAGARLARFEAVYMR